MLRLQQLFLLALVVAAMFVFELTDGCGFPMMGGGGGCGCGGGGGGGGCCGGRRKRSAAIQPHFRGAETPCPQLAWKGLIEKVIFEADANVSNSVSKLQTLLYNEFPDHKFFVACNEVSPTTTSKETNLGTELIKEPLKLSTNGDDFFSSAGDAYCTVQTKSIRCQAIAMTI